MYIIKNFRKGPLANVYRNVFPCDASSQSMINQCLLALAKIYFGLQNHESKVLTDGMRLYGQGLSEVNNALSKDNCNVNSEIIISVLALSVAEVCMLCPRSTSV